MSTTGTESAVLLGPWRYGSREQTPWGRGRSWCFHPTAYDCLHAFRLPWPCLRSAPVNLHPQISAWCPAGASPEQGVSPCWCFIEQRLALPQISGTALKCALAR